MDPSSSPPSLIDTLVENAKYMPSPEDANAGKEPSACELKCQAQQAALVSCMETIRQQNEESDSSSAKSNDANKCLAPSVAAWTDCCSKANHET
jgi:hypothetical protein